MPTSGLRGQKSITRFALKPTAADNAGDWNQGTEEAFGRVQEFKNFKL